MPERRYPLTSRVLDRRYGLPPGRPFTVTQHDVVVRDGTTIKVAHYAPTGRARGTVVTMTPYGRGAGIGGASLGLWAAHGFHTLVVSLRGTFGSGGGFDPMTHDGDDYRDAIAWMRRQAWYDGTFASVGASYPGHTQWALLHEPQPDHRAAVITVGPHDFASFHWGAGSLTSVLPMWASIVNDQERFLARSLFDIATKGRRVYGWLRRTPPAAAIARAMPRQKWVQDRIRHDDLSDPYWAPMDHSVALERVDIPVLITSGWQDLFVRQSYAQYRRLQERGVDVAYTIGPWAHTTGASSGARQAQEAFEWLAARLVGDGPDRAAAVHLHVTGAAEWRDVAVWPPETTQHRLHLAPGMLQDVPSDRTGMLEFDPADPPVFPGGTLLIGGGYVDDTRTTDRSDVLAFASAPMRSNLEVHGNPVVVLDRSAAQPDADVFCRLSDVDPNGRATNVAEGFQRVRADGVLRLELTPVAHRFKEGHRIRLAVAGGAHPHYPASPGTGANPMLAVERVRNRHTIRYAGSSLELPTT